MFEQVLQLSPTTLPLERIYLDPNNPRFATSGRLPVSDEDIDQDALQSELMNKMRREFAVDRLVDSMESNGYLPIDRIVVRRFGSGRYVVLEGNRRMTAAKHLRNLHEAGRIELDPRIAESLEEIPVLIYTGTDPEAAWIFQGIRHMGGIKDWPAYNKARLLVDQISEQDLTYTEAGRVFGVSRYQAAQWARAYHAFQQAEAHPDFHSDVDTRIFPYLQELFGRSNIPLREWLEWNDDNNQFDSTERWSEFLAWLYPKLTDQGEFDPDVPGEWEERWIPRAIDLRGVSELITDFPNEFLKFRNGTIPLNLALARAEAKREELSETAEDYAEQISDFCAELARLPVAQVRIEGEVDLIVGELRKLTDVLNEVIASLTND